MPGLSEKLISLEKALHNSMDQTINLAMHANPAGSEEWFEFMAMVGVDPLDSKTRSNSLKSGFQFNQGILPVEVRRVLERVKDDIAGRVQRFEENLEASNDTTAAVRDGFLAKLDEIVESRLNTYVGSIKPKAAVSAIFANAAVSTKLFEQQKAGSETKKCRCCGAARPADSDLKICAFCGTSFFK